MSFHQCAQFSDNPLLIREGAVIWITKYLVSISMYMDLLDGTCRLFTRGVLYKPNKENCIECYVDSDFTG